MLNQKMVFDGANQWCPPFKMRCLDSRRGAGMFDFTLAGDFVATVTLQRSCDNGLTWGDIKGFDAPVEKKDEIASSHYVYRVGIHPGDYTSGSATVFVGQD